LIDGQRGSPTRNTVGPHHQRRGETGGRRQCHRSAAGPRRTVGNYDFQIDVIDIANNALAGSFFPNQGPGEVAIDPIHHRAFVSVFTYVQEIELAPLASGSAIPVFVESGGLVINPISNKAYGGLFVTGGAVAKVSGSGFEGFIPGVNPASRYLFSERYNAANQYFITGHGFAIPQESDPGMLLLVDGATDTVPPNLDLATNPFPFGIGIDQVSNEAYIASTAGLTHGQLLHGDLSILDDPNNGAEAQGVGGPLPSGFPLNNTGALLGFGRHVVVNPANHKVYVMQLGGSPTSVAVFEPSDEHHQAARRPGRHAAVRCANHRRRVVGRVQVIRVHPALNRIYLGYVDQTSTSLAWSRFDSATDTVVAKWVGGAHSFRHTASFIVVNEAANRLYVSNYKHQHRHDARRIDAGGVGFR
jgi:DNA-binding beta-propeller fold protein YncE